MARSYRLAASSNSFLVRKERPTSSLSRQESCYEPIALEDRKHGQNSFIGWIDLQRLVIECFSLGIIRWIAGHETVSRQATNTQTLFRQARLPSSNSLSRRTHPIRFISFARGERTDSHHVGLVIEHHVRFECHQRWIIGNFFDKSIEIFQCFIFSIVVQIALKESKATLVLSSLSSTAGLTDVNARA